MKRNKLRRLVTLLDRILSTHDGKPEGRLEAVLCHHAQFSMRKIDLVEDLLPEDVLQYSKSQNRFQQCMSGNEAASPLGAIRDALKRRLQTPDDAAPTRFPWVSPKGRTILDRDLVEAREALRIGLAKACCVMCGSILEAALYSYLRLNAAWTNAEATKHFANKRKPGDISSDKFEEKWDLWQLIDFCRETGILVKQSTNCLDDSLRESRNFVHFCAEMRSDYKLTPQLAALSLASLEHALNLLAANPLGWAPTVK